MSGRLRHALALLSLSAVVLLPALVLAAGVEPLFDLSAPTTGPFPSDRFTALDLHNNTLLRVNLPKPDCAVRVTDCQDIDVINTLDGFNLQPRLSIPFSGPIDPASVSSDTVFLVSLGDALGGHGGHVGRHQPGRVGPGHPYAARGIGRASRPAHPLLAGRDHRGEGRRRSADRAGSLRRFPGRSPAPVPPARPRARGLSPRAQAGPGPRAGAPPPRRRRQHLHHSERDGRAREDPPAHQGHDPGGREDPRDLPAQQPDGHPVVPPERLALRRSPRASCRCPRSPSCPTASAPSPSGISRHPNWETAQGFIPPIGTRTGVPAVQSTNTLQFNLFLPSGAPPADGWPVAIFGHGFTDSKHGAPWAVGSTFAAHGIATIAINVVGHGGGAARHPDDHPGRRDTAHDPRRRARRRPGRQRRRSTRPRGPTRSRRAASSAIATACARPSPTSCSWCGSSRRAAFRA